MNVADSNKNMHGLLYQLEQSNLDKEEIDERHPRGQPSGCPGDMCKTMEA